MKHFPAVAVLLLFCSFSPALAAGPAWPPCVGWPPFSCFGPGPVVPPGVQPAKMTVVDANGLQIGTIVGADVGTVAVSVSVAVTVQGRGAILIADSAGVVDVHRLRGGSDLFFESPDCSGTPFLFQDAFRGGNSAIGLPGLTLYLPEPGDAPIVRAFLGFFDGRTGVCIAGAAGGPAVTAVPVIDLLTVFTPPFKLLFVPQ